MYSLRSYVGNAMNRNSQTPMRNTHILHWMKRSRVPTQFSFVCAKKAQDRLRHTGGMSRASEVRTTLIPE